MILKQRHTPFDRFLLHIVCPTLNTSPFRGLLRGAALWHTPYTMVKAVERPQPISVPAAARPPLVSTQPRAA